MKTESTFQIRTISLKDTNEASHETCLVKILQSLSKCLSSLPLCVTGFVFTCGHVGLS